VRIRMMPRASPLRSRSWESSVLWWINARLGSVQPRCGVRG
jgi:hypothetical protein